MVRKSLLSLTILAAIASPAFAGDPVPGVDVLLEQIPGGDIYRGTTDEDGNMQFGELPPGDYRVFQPTTEEEAESGLTNAELRTLRRTARRDARRAARNGEAEETPSLDVLGPATFMPLDGDSLGLLSVSDAAPVSFGAIAARELTGEEMDRYAIPLAEDFNSSRSNKGNEIEGDVGEGDVVEGVGLESLRQFDAEVVFDAEVATEAEAAADAEVLDRDATPMAAEDFNSSRSNKGNEFEDDAADGVGEGINLEAFQQFDAVIEYEAEAATDVGAATEEEGED